MAELLSQQEIDQLLNNIKSGNEIPIDNKEKEAVPFDFRLPNRISKNQLRILRNVHENFAEGLSSFLIGRLQSVVNINVVSIDQIYYSEYVLSVSNPACLFTFEIANTDIKGILELNADLAFTLVDRLLGGNGKGQKNAKIITPIEQKVLMIFVDEVMRDLRKSWSMIGDYEFTTERFESDIDFAQITSQSDSVLLISFEILIGENSYLMNLCFATYAFDAILNKISTQSISTIRPLKYEGTTSQNIIIENLKQAELNIKVEFGQTSITLEELTNLQVGDVIKLNKKIGEELIVFVETKPMFLSHPGEVDGHKAVKISKRIENMEI